MEDNKDKQDMHEVESNAKRDQDEGQMNNGTIGGNMGVIGGSNADEPGSGSKKTKPGNEGIDESSDNR